MIGKKNVVFGFLFLLVTASLGPYMITSYYPGVETAGMEKQTAVGRLQQLKANNYEEELEPLTADQLARANTDGVLALNALGNARAPIDGIKGGPHAHGNLEALLNIVVGIALSFMAVAPMFKQVISWLFILGTLLHSGMLLLVTLGFGFAGAILGTGIGPIMILLGLLSAGIAAFIGWRATVVND